jgi:hypothetical protein
MMIEWGSINVARTWLPVAPEPVVVAFVSTTLVLFSVDTYQPDNLATALRAVRIGTSGVLAIPWAALPVVVSPSAVAETSNAKIVLPEITLVVATAIYDFSFLFIFFTEVNKILLR